MVVDLFGHLAHEGIDGRLARIHLPRRHAPRATLRLIIMPTQQKNLAIGVFDEAADHFELSDEPFRPFAMEHAASIAESCLTAEGVIICRCDRYA